MSKIAFVFPGQGSQTVGMCKAFYDEYPVVKQIFEEADDAAIFSELLGEVVTDSTKKNLEMRVEAENGATAGKTDLA